MTHIVQEISIDADPSTVFERAINKNILSHLCVKGAKVVGSSWPLELKEGATISVTWEQFGLVHQAIYRVTQYKVGQSLCLKQTRGLFKTWLLKISTQPSLKNGTLLIVMMTYQLSFHLFGAVANDLWLRNQMSQCALDLLKEVRGSLVNSSNERASQDRAL